MTAEDAQNWGIIDKIVDTRKNSELTEKVKLKILYFFIF